MRIHRRSRLFTTATFPIKPGRPYRETSSNNGTISYSGETEYNEWLPLFGDGVTKRPSGYAEIETILYEKKTAESDII